MPPTTPVPIRAAPVVDIDPAVARAGLAGRLVGPHVPIAAGLARAAEQALLVGASAIQVFTDNPTAWDPRAEPHDGLDEFRESLRAGRIDLMVHASYLVNLATPDPVVFERSVERMRRELDVARGFGARALNVHIGSHKGSGVAAGIERVGEGLALILDGRPMDGGDPMLVLEDSAGQGGGVGVTVEELGAILDSAERHGAERSRLGICLDTAHLWGAGYALDEAPADRRAARQHRPAAGPRSPGHDPSQRLARPASVTARPPRAHRRRGHRGCRPAPPGAPSAPGRPCP